MFRHAVAGAGGGDVTTSDSLLREMRGHALECYDCDFGVFGLCATSKKTCASGEHCYSGAGTAVGGLKTKAKGCLAVAKCNLTTDTPLPGFPNATVFKITKTCCNTNLCNAASGPSAALVPLVLSSLGALLMTRVLV